MKTTTIIIGALLIGGGLYLYSKHEAQAQTQGPTLEDQANKALANETNPYVLRALAAKCRTSNLSALADLLDAKASALMAFQAPQQTKSVSVQQAPILDQHVSSAVAQLGAGVQNAPVLSLHQALQGGGLGGGGLLDPLTGNQ